jgi:hypothetical protein
MADMVIDGDQLRLWVKNEDEGDAWRYDLSTLKLRQRIPLARCTPKSSLVLLTRLRQTGVGLVHVTIEERDEQALLVLRAPEIALPFAAIDEAPRFLDLEVCGIWAAVAHRASDAVELRLVNLQESRIAWILRFEGAQLARVRITADDLLIADDLGRVQAISLRDGRVLRDLRVTV